MSDSPVNDFPGLYATAETGLFWDKDECEITNASRAAQVLKNMRKALVGGGHIGPATFHAYGDMTGLDFQSTDIKLNHFPAGEKNARHTKMLEDIVAWAAEHPEPSTLMLVMSDVSRDFLDVVDVLTTKKNYRFISVLPDPPRPPPRPMMLLIVPNDS
ncbi:putative endonuclease or glycosyl hydrolase [Raphanus sativus]|nr:putative endonuclease or glycosyl hydrolase [Raphanus sativus]